VQNKSWHISQFKSPRSSHSCTEHDKALFTGTVVDEIGTVVDKTVSSSIGEGVAV
jgi:hypothetical protein